ncbi:MAG: Crp/Fnr family transcriptional regulator [Syntrophothermus sp.]
MKIFKRGEIIAREGEIAREFFTLIDGHVGAYKENLLVSEFTHKGEVFGELAAILRCPRSLTLVAMEESHLMVYDKGYEDLVVKHPEFAKKLLVHLAARLEQTTDKLGTIKIVMENIH